MLWVVDREFTAARLETRDVELRLVPGSDGPLLQITSGHAIEWPGFTLFAPEGRWDLRGFRELSVSVTNTGDHPLEVGLRADAPGADEDPDKRITVVRDLAPGQTDTLEAMLHSTAWAFEDSLQLVGMRAAPGRGAIDLARVVKILIFVVQPQSDHRFQVGDVEAHGAVERLASAEFLPFIDRCGQFVHQQWSGKIALDADFDLRRLAEEADLRAHPAPAGRSRYGGWSDGPQLEATGYSRVQQHEGRWWLVDPEGYLFWSHGIDCVASWAAPAPPIASATSPACQPTATR